VREGKTISGHELVIGLDVCRKCPDFRHMYDLIVVDEKHWNLCNNVTSINDTQLIKQTRIQ